MITHYSTIQATIITQLGPIQATKATKIVKYRRQDRQPNIARSIQATVIPDDHDNQS